MTTALADQNVEKEEEEQGTSLLTRVGIIAAPTLSTALLLVAGSLASGSAGALWTGLSWIAGAAAGWCLGTFVSPQDDQETTNFARAATLLSGVVSGFVAAKLDKLFEGALALAPEAQSMVFMNGIVFATNTILAALLLFVLRSYE